MIDAQNIFDQAVNNNLKTYDSIRKIASVQGDDNTTGCLLGYPYFKKYKMIATDLLKQQAPDADAKTIQEINFTLNIS